MHFLKGNKLFRSVFPFVKWTFLGILCGVISGLACAVFLLVLRFAIELIGRVPYAFVLLPLIFLLCTAVNKATHSERDDRHQGTEVLIGAYNKKDSKLRLMIGPLKALLSVITIAFGGSAGKEGPSSFLAGTLCVQASRLFTLNKKDTKMMLLCGMAGGFAAVFGTPIASALFAIEIVVIRRPQIKALYPALLTSFVALYICGSLALVNFHLTIETQVFNPTTMLLVAGCALLLALVSLLYSLGMHSLGTLYKLFPVNDYLKAILGGLLIVGLAVLFGKEYLGLGETTFENILLTGTTLFVAAPLIKILFTAITLNWGGVGGVVTPMFFIGISTGASFGLLAGNGDPSQVVLFGAIGLIAMVSATCKTPLAATVLGLELFGLSGGIYFALAAVIAYLVTWKIRFFRTQIVPTAQELKNKTA